MTTLSVSPDSLYCTSGSKDGTLILWTTHSGGIVHEWRGHAAAVRCLAFSPDSRRLASSDGGLDGIVIWDVESGVELARLPWRKEPVFTCAWSPDGAAIAAGTDKHSILVWDAQTYKPLWTSYLPFLGHMRACELKVVRYSPDGRFLASGHEDSRLCLWDGCTGDRIAMKTPEPPAAHDAIVGIAWEPTGKRLATVSLHHIIRVWHVAQDLKEGDLMLDARELSGIRWVSFSAQGNLSSVLEDGKVKLWDTTGGEMCSSLLDREGAPQSLVAVCVSSDGNLIAAALADGTVKLWSVKERRCIDNFHESTKVGHLGFSPDGAALCCGGADGTVSIRLLSALTTH